MKWQNLTNRIFGHFTAFIFLLTLATSSPSASAPPTEDEAPFLLAKCWFISLEDEPLRLFASDNRTRIFISKAGGKVDAIDPLNGSKIWQSDFGGEIVSGLVIDASSIYLVSNTLGAGSTAGSSTLRSISKQTGLLNWKVPLPLSEEFFLHEKEALIVAASIDGHVISVKKVDGAVSWQITGNNKLLAAPQISASQIFLPVSGGVETLTLSDARSVTSLLHSAMISSIYLHDGQKIITGDTKGNLVAFDLPTQRVSWKFRNGAKISGIVPAGENILITSYDNFIYFMNANDGDLLWKRRLSGRVTGAPAIGPTFASVNVVGEPGASFIDIKTGKLLNRLSFADEGYASAAVILANNLTVFARPDGLYGYAPGKCAAK